MTNMVSALRKKTRGVRGVPGFFPAGSSMSELRGRVHGIAGQGDQPRRRGHDADAAPKAVAGHDLGGRRGLEKRSIFGGQNGEVHGKIQRIRLRENLQETIDFPIKYGAFL